MLNLDRLLSERALAIDASGIRRVFDLATSVHHPINLSIGQPHFDVPEPVKEAAIEAIRSGHNKYTVTQGAAELRARLSERFNARFQREGRWADYATLITSGVSGGLVLALMSCLNPGDEVLAPDPYFVMYKHLTTLAGGRAVFVDTYPDFRLTADRVEPMISPRTRALVVSSPSNPTGVVLREAEWRDLVDLAERYNLLLISDEIYDVFCYEPVDTPVGPRCPSPASFSDQILVLRGFSKTYAMTGWRMGAAFGPAAIIEQMTKLQQYTFVCAPSMAQQAAITALDVDMRETVAAYRAKRDRVVEALRPYFNLATPGGAFYAFVEAPAGMTGTQFVERAIARDLLIIPGGVFSEKDTHFRISYACDDATLDRGLALLVELATSSL